jgi:uncharacterized damage-inducible protein DinB
MDKTLGLFMQISFHRIYDHYQPKLLQAIQSLTVEELWETEANVQNSIGGIVLHICEHLKRNAMRYSNREVSFSKGIEDYFPGLALSPQELSIVVQDTLNHWKDELAKLKNNNGFGIGDMHSLYHLVEHTGYHLGQIVDRVKRVKYSSFQFAKMG